MDFICPLNQGSTTLTDGRSFGGPFLDPYLNQVRGRLSNVSLRELFLTEFLFLKFQIQLMAS